MYKFDIENKGKLIKSFASNPNKQVKCHLYYYKRRLHLYYYPLKGYTLLTGKENSITDNWLNQLQQELNCMECEVRQIIYHKGIALI